MAPLCLLAAQIFIVAAQLGLSRATEASTTAHSNSTVDGCFTEDTAQTSCGWTGACSLDGCEEKCLPVFRELVAEDLGTLWEGRGAVALQCEVLAAIVLDAVNTTASTQTRKLHNKGIENWFLDGADTKVQRGLFPALDKLQRGSSRLALGTKQGAMGKFPDLVHPRRLLEQPMQLRQQGCPTPEQLDMAAPKMKQDSKAAQEWLEANLPEDQSTRPGYLLLKAIHANMENPEALKTMMLERCESGVVSTDPLKETYFEVQRDKFEETYDIAWTGGVPESLQVCRPKDLSDTAYLVEVDSMNGTCADARAQVANGTCMKEAVVEHFHAPCAESWWSLTGASDTERTTLMQKFDALHDNCAAISTQEECEAADLEVAETAIRTVLSQVAASTLKFMTPQSNSTNTTDMAPPINGTNTTDTTPSSNSSNTTDTAPQSDSTNTTKSVTSAVSETRWKAVSTLVAVLAFIALQF